MVRLVSVLAACGLALAASSAAALSGGPASAPGGGAAPQVRAQHLGSGSRQVEGRLGQGDSILGDGSYFDCYSFDVRAGQKVSIGMFSGDFDAFLSLHDGAACDDLIESDDDSLGGSDPAITWIAPRSGRYSIAANSLYEDDTGIYGLALIIE